MGWAVLLVEDDHDYRELLVEVLETRGYRVRTAGDGRQALELLRDGEQVPAVILLDLMMPVMDGRELLGVLAGDPMLAQVPTIILSAQPDRSLLGGQVKAVLPKVLKLPDLLATIAQVCETAELLGSDADDAAVAAAEPGSAGIAMAAPSATAESSGPSELPDEAQTSSNEDASPPKD